MLELHTKEKMQIQFEIDISAPPEQVWKQLATKDGMRKWFSTSLIFDMQIGGEFRMEVNHDGHWIFFGEVQKIVPNQELAFTWTQQEVGQEAWPIATLVTFKLEEIPSGTRVSLVHSGFDALDEAMAEKEYSDHIQGWQASDPLGGLKSAVEENHSV